MCLVLVSRTCYLLYLLLLIGALIDLFAVNFSINSFFSHYSTL